VSEPILATEDLTKSFGALVANDGISVSVEQGAVHGIMGPNGSGKSTFFNTVTGFYEPDDGTVVFDGEEITARSPDRIARRGLGRTFQIPSPFEGLTVRENLLSVFTGGVGSGLRVPTAKRDRADELLEIDHVAGQAAGEISGGQEKLLELGRVLMLDPACVLLDEPTAGVNPALQDRLLDHLETLNDRGTTFMVIEHDMSAIADVCDRVTVFDQGSVLVEGSFEAVTDDERVQDAYLGDVDHDASVGELVGASIGGSVAAAADDSAGDGATGDDGSRLVADDITSGYGNHTIVDGVSIRSRLGITCVFGPNGSGKSTLLKTLAGTVPAWSGMITHDETDITARTPAETVERGITMLPQDGGVFGELTVRENVLLGGYTVADSATREHRMEEVLAAFPELDDRRDERGQSLSGGQQMMLSFARAMMTDAGVYLLDEPSSGLAPSLIDDVFEMTRRLVDSGAQVVFVEQNVREALESADHVYILAQGRLQFDGPPGQLADEDDLVDLYLGLE